MINKIEKLINRLLDSDEKYSSYLVVSSFVMIVLGSILQYFDIVITPKIMFWIGMIIMSSLMSVALLIFFIGLIIAIIRDVKEKVNK